MYGLAWFDCLWLLHEAVLLNYNYMYLTIQLNDVSHSVKSHFFTMMSILDL